MRRGVFLALVCACIVAIPAAGASTQAETVTLKVGQTVPLKTVFDKTKRYRIVMSGLVTMTLKEGNQTLVYDPFYGAQDANCTNSGASVHLQIKDAAGNLIDFAGAGKPPCRKDHRYEFLVNDSYPPGWELHGKATSYITLQPDPKFWTVGGAFTLRVEEEPAEPVAVVIFGARSNKKGLLANTSLTGRGVMDTTDRKGDRLANPARFLPRPTVPEFQYDNELRDRRITMEVTSGRLWMQGAPGSKEERLSLDLLVEVVVSNKPSCPARTKTRRGARGKLVLVDYPRGAPDDFISADLQLPCGVNEGWSSDDSDVTIRLTKLKKK